MYGGAGLSAQVDAIAEGSSSPFGAFSPVFG